MKIYIVILFLCAICGCVYKNFMSWDTCSREIRTDFKKRIRSHVLSPNDKRNFVIQFEKENQCYLGKI